MKGLLACKYRVTTHERRSRISRLSMANRHSYNDWDIYNTYPLFSFFILCNYVKKYILMQVGRPSNRGKLASLQTAECCQKRVAKGSRSQSSRE